MTVLMTSELPGLTQEGYDHLAAALLPVMRSTDGFIAHAAGPVDGGFEVTELWESEAAHEAWFTAHVAPTMPAGAPVPQVTYRPVVNVTLR
jgi:hypothetical protein